MPDLPPPSAEIVAIEQRLVECGLNKSGFAVVYDEDIRGITIEISSRAGASAKNLACIRAATKRALVNFADTELASLNDDQVYAEIKPALLQTARETLERRGLLVNLPQPGKFAKMRDFVAAIEGHCGLAAGEVLTVKGDEIRVRPKSLRVEGPEFEKLQCLLASLQLSGFDRLVFEGNEAFR
jgi:hypothetical protein